MEILSVNSTNGRVKITASTAADISVDRVRFKSCVNDVEHFDTALAYVTIKAHFQV